MSTLSDAAPPPPRPSAPPVQPAAARTIVGIGGSGSHVRIQATPGAMLQQTGSAPAYPRAVPGDRLIDEAPPSKGVGWQLITVIAIAAVVGSLTMLPAMKNRGGSDTTSTPAVIAIDAAVAKVEEPPPMPPTIDAAVATVEIDAAVAVVEIDAAIAEPPPPVVEPAPVVVAKPEPKKPRKSELEAAWDAGNWNQVIARCGKTNDDVRCALAACKAQNESKARAYLAKVDKAKRKGVINACKNANVDLDDPPQPVEKKPPEKVINKDCENNPMACQH
jgi:hypothetical protein